MISRKLKIAALAIVAAGTLAGAAQASVVDTRAFKLTSTGYDFGGSAWAFGAPTGNGELHFHHESGQMRPHLLGTLHLNDADGTCARMRLRYYGSTGAVLQTSYGGTVCAFDDQHHSWSVDLDPYVDDAISSVNVAVMKQTATGEYVATSATYGPQIWADTVEITESGVDFGGSGWSLGAPAGASYLSWGLSAGVVSPNLVGSLHLNNSSGGCARMNLRYLTEGGSFLASRAGGTVCAADNGHHSWSVDLEPYSSSLIGQVTVQLQTLAANGTYLTAGSKTVSIAE